MTAYVVLAVIVVAGIWIGTNWREWSDPEWVPTGDTGALMKVAARARHPMRRRRAIYALQYVAETPERFEFLERALDDPAVATAAVHVLGKGTDPRGKEIAMRLARSGGPLAKAAAEAVEFDLRPPSELIEVALNSEWYKEVRKAVLALRAWGTPEAEDALRRFRQGAARSLKNEFVEGLDGRGEPDGHDWWTAESTASLGQAIPEEVRLDRARAAKDRADRDEEARFIRASDSLLVLGKPGDVAEFARRCLADPKRWASAERLQDYLKEAGSSESARELHDRLREGATHELADAIAASGGQAAIYVLETLAFDEPWTRLLASEISNRWRYPDGITPSTRMLCDRYPSEMAELLGRELLTCPPITKLAAAAAGCGPVATPHIRRWIQRLEPLLHDAAWPTRRDAIDCLATVRNEAAKEALREYVEWEQDADLQERAIKGIRAQDR